MFQPNQDADGIAFATRETIQLRNRPELRIDSRRFLDSGIVPYDGAVVGVELAGSYKNLSLQGEYYAIEVDQKRAPGLPSPNLLFDGCYVQGGWIITGESRRYNANTAAFASPRPDRPFRLGEGGGTGAFELVARYSFVDLNDQVRPGLPSFATGGVRGGEQEIYTVGLNWYPSQNVRFPLDDYFADVDRRDVDGRTQIGQIFSRSRCGRSGRSDGARDGDWPT